MATTPPFWPPNSNLPDATGVIPHIKHFGSAALMPAATVEPLRSHEEQTPQQRPRHSTGVLVFYLGARQELLRTGLTQKTCWAASSRVGFNSLSSKTARAGRDVQAPSTVNREKWMALQSCPVSGCPPHPSHLPHCSEGNSFSPCQTASCPASSTPPVFAYAALRDFSTLHQKPSPCHAAQPFGVPAEDRVAIRTGPWFPNAKETTKLSQHPGFSYFPKVQRALLSSAV